MKKEIIRWIKNWFKKESGNAEGIVVGISGGKDSTVVAKLCCEAIGNDKVFGVMMPNGEQYDIDDALRVCEILDIPCTIANIEAPFSDLFHLLNKYVKLSDEAYINIAPRLRMTVLYAMAQSLHYRVAGTGNLSERTVGYFTKWGDGACDFNPIGNLTKTEVVKLGLELGLPKDLIEKTPTDGLSDKSDEDNLGFTYELLDKCIRNPNLAVTSEDSFKIAKIQKRIEYNKHKLNKIPMFEK